MAVAFVSQFRVDRDKMLGMVFHMSRALRLLNESLSDANVPREQSVALIVLMAIVANLIGDVHESRIHLGGLERLLEILPGGLTTIHTMDRELANKIRHIDMQLALRTGESMLFNRPLSPITPLVTAGFSGMSLDYPLPYPFEQISLPLQYLTRDVIGLCACAGRVQLDAYQYQDIVITIFQRLLDFNPLSTTRSIRLLDDICQLGLLACMATILHPTDYIRASYCTLLSGLLRTRLEQDYKEIGLSGSIDEFPALRLWLIFFLGFSICNGDQRAEAEAFITSYLCSLAGAFNLRTWNDVKNCLSGLPWIPVMHDVPGKKLWAVAESRGLPESSILGRLKQTTNVPTTQGS
jgi:hypothetical protein